MSGGWNAGRMGEVADLTDIERGDDDGDLVGRARVLMELVDREAAEGERLGRLTDAVDQAFHDSGLWGMWVPRALGGSELWPVASSQIIESMSYADGSAGWVLMAGVVATGLDSVYIGDAAAAELYPGGRLLVHAGQGGFPGGRLTPVDGGYSLTGAWSFGSGVKHARIIHTGAIVAGTGELRVCVLPAEDVVFAENWDVLGLRATGSIDYTTDSLFVPEAFTYPMAADVPLRGGIVYSLGIINFGMVSHTSWALGVGRRILDELEKLVKSRSGRPGGLAESDAFLGDLAMAEAKWRGCHALALETWQGMEDTLRRGDHVTIDQETMARLTLQHATWTIEEVCTFAYIASGTTGLRDGIIQRCYRDMHSGSQHIGSSPPVRQNCGRMLTGQAKGKHWQATNLVE